MPGLTATKPATGDQVRRLLVFVCTPGIVLAVATLSTAYGLGAFSQSPQSPRSVPVSCRVRVVDRTRLEIAVYNGSGIQGQAQEAARQLTAAGFRIATVGTAPEARWTDASAVISYGPEGRDVAELLAARIPEARRVRASGLDHGIDVVVGTRFTGLTHAIAVPGSHAGDGRRGACPETR